MTESGNPQGVGNGSARHSRRRPSRWVAAILPRRTTRDTAGVPPRRDASTPRAARGGRRPPARRSTLSACVEKKSSRFLNFSARASLYVEGRETASANPVHTAGRACDDKLSHAPAMMRRAMRGAATRPGHPVHRVPSCQARQAVASELSVKQCTTEASRHKHRHGSTTRTGQDADDDA